MSSAMALPAPLTKPIERSLNFVGSHSVSAGMWLLAHESGALASVRPWWQFFDLSSFYLPDGGPAAYWARLKSNAGYFRLNYLQVGIFAAAASAITKPTVLIGGAGIAFVYFRLFGEAVPDVVEVAGVELGHDEKVGVIVVLGAVVFLCAAGGLGVFEDVICGALVSGLVHGCLRAVPVEAQVEAEYTIL